MTDISPELLEKIRNDFRRLIEEDEEAERLLEKIRSGSADYSEAEAYSLRVAEALSQALGNYLTPDELPKGKFYYNIAEKVLGPLIREDYELVTEAARQVQESLNKKAGLGLRAQVAKMDEERVLYLISEAADAEDIPAVLMILGEPVKNLSLSFVTETLKKNVEFHGESGLRPTVTRSGSWKACEWCRGLVGKYIYPAIPRDVWRRHQYCRCTVLSDPGDGSRVNVHTKAETITRSDAKTESRKFMGMKANGVQISGASDQVIDRLSSASVTSQRVIDAIKNPVHVRSAKLPDGSSIMEIIGKGATLHVDSGTGKLVNAFQTHSQTVKRYRKKGKK